MPDTTGEGAAREGAAREGAAREGPAREGGAREGGAAGGPGPQFAPGPGGPLPFVADLLLADHHCHGVIRRDVDRRGFEALLTEAGDAYGRLPGRAPGHVTLFDSQAGLAVRRWCPPVLGLPAHAEPDAYLQRRADLGAAEVSRLFLRAAGLGALCVDTGFEPEPLTSPAEMGAMAGAPAWEIVRLEQVAESVAAAGAGPSGFADAFRQALAVRARHAAGVKTVAAYRAGLDLGAARPTEAEVAAAAARWLGPAAGSAAAASASSVTISAHSASSSVSATSSASAVSSARTAPGEASGAPPPGGAAGRAGPAGGARRLADPVLHRFLIWCGADLGLPVQVHVGYGDRDVDLNRCNPLLLTPLLRALEPAGTPVMLLHNYPYHREAGYLAQVLPHVYVDLGLATHNLGQRAGAVIAETLELVPFGKFLYSSDGFGLPELHYLGAVLFRRAVSRFLRAGLDDGAWTEADAARIARLAGHENAARVYRLASRAR